MSEKSSFRSLLEMSDKIAREELGDYYVIGASRMHNMLDCLEDGAKQIQELTAENERLRKRDGNATIIICETTDTIPFHQERLKIIDFGVSDNLYMVERDSEI
jgi:hypothetical protein